MPGYRAGVKPYRAGYPDASSGRRMNSVELDADKSVVVEAEAGPSQLAGALPPLRRRPPAPEPKHSTTENSSSYSPRPIRVLP